MTLIIATKVGVVPLETKITKENLILNVCFDGESCNIIIYLIYY